jgi:hypothetical protein
MHHKLALPLITKKIGRIKKSKYNLEAEKCLETVVDVLNQSTSSKALSVNWTADELQYDLSCRFSNIFFREAGRKKGLILYYRMNLLGHGSSEAVHPISIVDCVRFEKMSFFEKHKFISDFCSHEKEMGSCMVLLPTMPGFELRPFYTNLFYPTGRYHCFVGSDINNLLEIPLHLDYLVLR